MQLALTLQNPATPLRPLVLDGAYMAARIAALDEIAEGRRWALASLKGQRFCGHKPGTPSGDNVTWWFRKDIAALSAELRERLV
jgi:hypothetical protein